MNLDDEDLCVLTTVPGEFEATAIVSALEAEGIRARAVGGFTAGSIDFSHVLSRKLPLFLGIVILLSALLLLLVFRSIVIPLQAAVLNLLTVGAGTVIRKDSYFGCYRAHAGWIQTGTVTLGQHVFVGEKSVLDIDTSMGDQAQLGHASAEMTRRYQRRRDRFRVNLTKAAGL